MRPRWLAALLLPVLLVACKKPEQAADPEDVACGGDEVVVEITTSDDLTLRADLLPAPAADRGAVVLFHMKPPGYHRGNWPEHVRAALGAEGVAVLNVDRRGAGESEGVAEDAYLGPGALRDMEAAVRLLTDGDLGCAVDPARLVLVGASNGTTATMDYVVAHDAALPAPAAVVWMSPGTYTENQNAIADHRATLDPLPMLWLYPTTEPWSQDFLDGASASWTLTERGDQHGTKMFDGGELEDQTVADLTGFVATHAGP